MKELIGKYQMLSEEEKELLKRIEENGARIKEYENQQFKQAIC